MTEVNVNHSTDTLELFLSGFKARDLAEPLPSFDDSAALRTVRDAMHALQVEVCGVRKSGIVCGWASRDDVAKGTKSLVGRPFEESSVISDTTSLTNVVQGLKEALYLFVRSMGQVSGLIRRSDLQKPAMRMWLFGLVTISELRVTRMIDEYCPQDSWRKYLSEGRLLKAHELRLERKKRGQLPSLLDCLQFADKGRIVARHEPLRQQTRFASQREVEEFVKALEDLRNNLAHSQDLSGNWDVILDLTTNLHRIVVGNPDGGSPSTVS
jgi:hypothetical protein